MFASPGAIAIQIGPLAIRWYGIFTAAAILVGLWLVDRQARAEGLPADDIAGCIGWAIAAGYVGARLYEVAFNWDYYGRNWAKIPAVWEGGLAIHGGLIVGSATCIALLARRGLPVLRTMDIAAVAAPIAQAIGRWGNFFNEEAFGRPTDLPWGLYISPARRPLGYRDAEFFHPAFLYESLWDLAVFVVLVRWLRPRWHDRPGALAFWYVGLYSIGRFAIESIRVDSFWAGGYRVPQLASVAGLIVSVWGLVWVSRRARSGAIRGGPR
jgi:phosphatidylglycerol:prolipoprotein diacylglycerol transferase